LSPAGAQLPTPGKTSRIPDVLWISYHPATAWLRGTGRHSKGLSRQPIAGCDRRKRITNKNSIKVYPEKLLIVGVQLFEIGPGSFSELQQVADLFEENFRGPVEPSRNQIIEFVKRGVYRLFVLKKDDLPSGKSVAGMVLTSTYGQKFGEHVEYLAVSNECQGKGLGSLLIKSLVAQLRRNNLIGSTSTKKPHLLTLECTKQLVNFYKRSDFELSSLPPFLWNVEHDGVVSPVEYFFMGTSIDPRFGTAGLDDFEVMFKYRELLKDSCDHYINVVPR